MAILKNELKDNFSIISNIAFHNKNLSLKAMGLYALISSLPNNWKFSDEGLASITKDGITSVKSALKELEENNILFRFRPRMNDGTLKDTVYYIPSNPLTQLDKQNILDKYNNVCLIVTKQPELENPPVDNPTVDKPTVENLQQINTNIINTNKINIYNHHSENDENNIDIDDDNNLPLEEKDRRFELIWEIYPRKLGKVKSYEYYLAYLKGRKIGNKKYKLSTREIYQAVNRYVETIEKNKTETQFILHGSTFFNQKILDYIVKEE